MTPELATQNYKWCKYNKDTNTIELYMDHYMLSCLRTCEAKFYLEHLLKIKPRYVEPEKKGDKIFRKPWFFDFGEFVHYCLEHYYNSFKVQKTAPPIDTWLELCKNKWLEMEMDNYKDSIVEADVKKYDEVKGWTGICGMLTQYYVFYMDQRMRVIDTEITFGHNKEVKIGEFYIPLVIETKGYQKVRGVRRFVHTKEIKQVKVECYLTGRIDLLVDNGYKIGPIDHKTTHKFDGFEHVDFNPHDAMTGYILAIHDILGKYYTNQDKADAFLGKPPVSRGGWIFHLSACTPAMPNKESQAKGKKQGPRFKTTPIDKTPSQLEDFKARQLSTFKRVTDLLFMDKVPEWQTTACHNMFFRHCEYVPIHEQPSEQWKDIINRFYVIGEEWDTREHTNKDGSNNKKVVTNGNNNNKSGASKDNSVPEKEISASIK